MQYTTNCGIVFKGDRIRKGGIIEMTDEEAAVLDPADISPVGGEQAATAAEEQWDETPIEEMSQAQLKARAKELGLKQAGSVADLRERITLHLTGDPDEEGDITSE